MADPLDHETHRDLLIEIRDALDVIRDHLSEMKLENRAHYKEIQDILIEIDKNTEL